MNQQSVAHEKHQRNYQNVKGVFNALHPFSQPDSLTRRGEMLILRRALAPRSLYGAIRDWEETVITVVPNAKIRKSTIDRQNQLRVWFEIQEVA